MTQGYLTTHVLDTARGGPAAGLGVTLYRLTAEGRHRIVRTVTNADGRADGPLLKGADFEQGTYEIVFDAGTYLRSAGWGGAEPLFLDQIPIRFGIADTAAHYHVPLLLSPFGYSTYRGS